MLKQLRFSILGFSLLIIIGSSNTKLAIDRNICAVHVLSSIVSHFPLVDEHYRFECSSYFQGLLALNQNQTKTAEHHLRASFATVYSPFARVYLITMWKKINAWERIQAYLQSPESLDTTFLIRLATSRLPESKGAETSRWLRIMQIRQPDYILFYAKELLKAQRFAEAETWVNNVNLPSQFDEAELIKGESVFYQQQFARAATIFESSYQRNPQSVEVAYWYGRSLVYAGRLQQGIALLEHAIQIAGHSPSPWYLYELGKAYMAVGRCWDAKTTVQLAFNNYPDTEIALQLHTFQMILANCK